MESNKRMIKLKYTNEKTFITEDVEFTNEHYDLAKKIHMLYKQQDTKSLCTPIMVGNDKQSLIFGVNIHSTDWYKVTIEKPIFSLL